MNIYLIRQEKVTGYETYDSAVVIAESEEAAASMHPEGKILPRVCNHTWVNSPEEVEVTFLGVAAETHNGQEVVCASFNAG